MTHHMRSLWPSVSVTVGWSTPMRAKALLDTPARISILLRLPWDAPALPVFERRTSVMLGRISNGKPVSRRKELRTFNDAGHEVKLAYDMVERMLRASRLFERFAFTQEQIETMPEGYRQALVRQRSKPRLTVIEGGV